MLFKKNTKVKKTIDFNNENFELLEKYKVLNNGASHNEIINYLIETFTNLDPKVKKNLAKSCDLELKKMDREIVNESPYEKLSNQNIQSDYKNLFNFFSNGESSEITETMKRIEIKDGYVLFPDDWIILFETKAKSCKYAGVIEVKNGQKYNAPHFIFFSEKPINKLTDKDTRIIDEECCLKIPKYKDIIKDTVPLKFGKDHKPVNMKEHIESPIPGYFMIPEYEKNSINTYPFGAMVLRSADN